MSADDLHERFPCPVPWCQGFTWTHGGDGADPSSWMHESAARQLAGGITVTHWASDLDGDRWTLHTRDGGEIHEAPSPHELADVLAQVSAQLRALAVGNV